MNKGTIKTILVLMIITLSFLVIKQVMRISDTEDDVATTDSVKIDFYVMSQCPYGTQVEDGIYPVLQKFGDSIDFNLDFIANEDDGEFGSLHGEPEVKGDIVQLCAAEHDEKYMDMIICMNKDMRNIPNNWEECAEGLNVEKIKECYDGEEGKELLSASLKKAQEANARGSPTMYINDELYNGGRDELSFTRAVCQLIEDEECDNIPECGSDMDCVAQPEKNGICNEGTCIYEDPVEVEMIVLNDKKCTDCDTSNILGVTSQLFKGVNIRYVDIADDEGKELIEEYDIMIAPAYLFDDALNETRYREVLTRSKINTRLKMQPQERAI